MSVIPKIPRVSGGFAPWAPYQGSSLDQLGTSPDPSPTHDSLTTNPGSVPEDEGKQSKNTRQYVLDTTLRKQAHLT